MPREPPPAPPVPAENAPPVADTEAPPLAAELPPLATELPPLAAELPPLANCPPSLPASAVPILPPLLPGPMPPFVDPGVLVGPAPAPPGAVSTGAEQAVIAITKTSVSPATVKRAWSSTTKG